MLARVLRGVGANAFGQFAIMGIQLAMVPVLATHWGLKVYGTWLMLFTIPSYLALGDFGFATAAGVDMTMKVARDDRAGAVSTYHSALAAVLALSSTLLVVALIICALLPTRLVSFNIPVSAEDIRIVLCLIAAYGIICLASSIFMAGFRCSGLYATGVMTQSCTQLIESGACIVVVAMGGSLRAAATAYVVSRLLCVAGQAGLLSYRAPWLPIGLRGARVSEVKRLAHPAAAALALPFSQAIFLQGTPVVLGVATSAATVPIFTTVRTLIRSGVQLTTLLNHAIMPEFSTAVAREDHRTQRGFLFATLATNAAILIPGAIVLLVWGQQIVQLWTHGAVRPPWVFLALMTAVMVVNGMWHPVSNLILAANRHAAYSYVFLIMSIMCVAICYPLAVWKQAAGAAMSLLVLDSVMLVVVMRLASQLLIAKPATQPGSAETVGAVPRATNAVADGAHRAEHHQLTKSI